ncbi:MAG: YqgE/AlgH family protein [Cyclobacteriaceae bacterium]
MEFFKYKNRVPPAKGRMLVSEPYLPDPNFERTIILMCEHNQDGSFGFVLNKPSLAKVGDLVDGMGDFEVPVFVGGPVQQDTLHYIHRCGDLEDAIQISDDIYWGGNFENLVLKIDTNQLAHEDIKFFIGYSGWSPGQLEEELKADSWIVSDQINQLLVFETDPAVMWQQALKLMGGRFSVYSNYPVDPRMN